MNEKTYRQKFNSEDYFDEHQKRIDKRIAQFSNSFLNNAKWKKVFLTIFSNVDLVKQCEIKDFFSSCYVDLRTELQDVKFEKFIYSDYIDEFITTGEYPISYREIEYLEFLKSWNGKFIGKLVKSKPITQDTEKIKKILSTVGQFEWEEYDNSVRLIAYR